MSDPVEAVWVGRERQAPPMVQLTTLVLSRNCYGICESDLRALLSRTVADASECNIQGRLRLVCDTDQIRRFDSAVIAPKLAVQAWRAREDSNL